MTIFVDSLFIYWPTILFFLYILYKSNILKYSVNKFMGILNQCVFFLACKIKYHCMFFTYVYNFNRFTKCQFVKILQREHNSGMIKINLIVLVLVKSGKSGSWCIESQVAFVFLNPIKQSSSDTFELLINSVISGMMQMPEISIPDAISRDQISGRIYN